jgi:low affinity Fe/Cu permease
MPSDDSGTSLTWFDRFASAVSNFTSRAWFFAFCLLLVLLRGRRSSCSRTWTPGS